MGICATLRIHLLVLINVDISQYGSVLNNIHMFKLHISLNYAVIPDYVTSERGVVLKAIEIIWFHVTHVYLVI